jgi:flavin reductase (DIM6/NTAB) family NADH-FMN oxidoreductase RutF
VPKPLVFVSTVDRKGTPNVVTVAYVTFVSQNPPVLALGLGKYRTLRNIRAIREFVVNVPDKNLAEEAWIIGEVFAKRRIPKGINKFDLADLTRIPGERVKPPRVRECFAHLECRVLWIKKIGGANLVLGEVVAASYESEKFDQEMVVHKDQLSSLLLVAGNICSAPGVVFSIDVKHAEKRAEEKLLSFRTGNG